MTITCTYCGRKFTSLATMAHDCPRKDEDQRKRAERKRDMARIRKQGYKESSR